jgi:hypothetical protein
VLIDLVNAFGGLCFWTFVWACVVTVYLNLFERRRGFPSRRHRFALVFVAGPLVWLAMAWEALEDGGRQ